MLATTQPKTGLIPNQVLGMLLFVGTEIMFFSGLISMHLLIRTGETIWPPFGQPRLPVEATAFNSVVLLLSGLILYKAGRVYASPFLRKRVHRMVTLSMALGTFFVLFQGYEWVQLLGFGLTIKSSLFGAIFYVLIGMHALHVTGGLAVLVYAWAKIHPDNKQGMDPDAFSAVRIFWYFVVGIWPILYVLVYLV